MKLSKINYKSAIFFGVFAFLIYFISGAFSMILSSVSRGYANYLGQYIIVTPLNALLITPVTLGLVYYVMALLAILIYNQVARKFPITWEVKK